MFHIDKVLKSHANRVVYLPPFYVDLSLNEFESVCWGRGLQYKMLKMEKLTVENNKSIEEKELSVMKTCDRRQASLIKERHSCRGRE